MFLDLSSFVCRGLTLQRWIKTLSSLQEIGESVGKMLKKKQTNKNSLWKVPSGFPGCSVVGSLPASVGDVGFDSGSGRIPRALEQPSPWATTTKPVFWSPGARTAEAWTLSRKRSHHKKPVRRSWRVAPALDNWRKARAAEKTQNSQI